MLRSNLKLEPTLFYPDSVARKHRGGVGELFFLFLNRSGMTNVYVI
jgi:hypothetical protein